MYKHHIIVVYVIVLLTTVAYSKNNIENQIGRLSRLQGDDYVAERDLLLRDIEPEHVQELHAIRDDIQKDWNIRALAGILVERHERNAEFEAFAQRNWLDDPEYDPTWRTGKTGAFDTTGAMELLLRRYHEAGFWYHYFEHFWKNITTLGASTSIGIVGHNLTPVWGWIVFREPAVNDRAYYGPSEFKDYFFKWALDAADEIVGFDMIDPRSENVTALAGLVWNIISSENTRESREVRIALTKREVEMTAVEKWMILNHLIWHAEYRDEADMYETFLKEHLSEHLMPDSPTLVEFSLELIEKLRQKDEPGTLRSVLRPPPSPSTESPRRELVEDPFERNSPSQ